MQVVYSHIELQQVLKSDFGRDQGARKRGATLGFVPTMGALHPGHISLVEKAKQECNQVCVSIFVNPLQFGPNEDFSKYPRTIDADLALLEKAGLDIVYLPDVEDIYPNIDIASFTKNRRSDFAIAQGAKKRGTGVDLSVNEDSKNVTDVTFLRSQPRVQKREFGDEMIYANPELANCLCGLNRPGHFDGVCTVVKRLFDIVKPDRAYFGKKDYQQLMIIRDMVDRLAIPVEIIGCPILREPDGLAMSSRNRYLSAEERKLAPMLYAELLKLKRDAESLHSLTRAHKCDISYAIHRLESQGFQVDYLEIRWNRIFIAAKLGTTRLIDNVNLS